MRRLYVALGLVAAVALLAGILMWNAPPGVAQPSNPPPQPSPRAAVNPLPVSQVVLFNSGVGYFHREGTIDGNARVDLLFPAEAVNDLLKSLVLQDQGDGLINAVNYDSQEPVEKTLKSFALDLTYNPTLGQLLNQARGQKVEVTLQQSANSPAGTLTGQIVGMETQHPAGQAQPAEIDVLNMLCAEGLRSVPLSQVLRVRFLDPQLDEDFRRALSVLASARDGLKKTVSLAFLGEGQRRVSVGYVVENPMWKTSYRLVIGKDGKPALHAWAVVENTSDEDWKDVRMVLVAGRPISFEMNLYQPLFVPRPTVEPEHFASLRPPVFGGAMIAGQLGENQGQMPAGNLGAFGNLGGQTGFQGGFAGNNANGFPIGNRYQFGNLGGQLGMQGGQVGQFGNLGAQFGIQGGWGGNTGKLSFQELQNRRQQAREQALQQGPAVAALSPAELAAGDHVGESYQYTIDQKVTLPRQKSALLPILRKDVGGQRVCIYNPAVHARHPLQGLRFKNTTGMNLMQGPITVFDGGVYAGDARLPDMQPGEERLVGYALETGIEVKPGSDSFASELTKVKIDQGVVEMTHKERRRQSYLIKNRTKAEQTVVVEAPITEGWELTGEAKPLEQSRNHYRFEVKVPAGQSVTHEVIEQQVAGRTVKLMEVSDDALKLVLVNPAASAEVKAAFKKELEGRGKLAQVRRELASLTEKLKAFHDDQDRLRANLDKMPRDSAAYKRYIEKFDTQETQVEKLQEQIKELQDREQALLKECTEYMEKLNVK